MGRIGLGAFGPLGGMMTVMMVVILRPHRQK